MDAQINPYPQNAAVGLLTAHREQLIGSHLKIRRLVFNLYFVIAEIDLIFWDAPADAARMEQKGKSGETYQKPVSMYLAQQVAK